MIGRRSIVRGRCQRFPVQDRMVDSDAHGCFPVTSHEDQLGLRCVVMSMNDRGITNAPKTEDIVQYEDGMLSVIRAGLISAKRKRQGAGEISVSADTVISKGKEPEIWTRLSSRAHSVHLLKLS